MNRSLLRVLRSAPARPDGQLLAQYARHRDEEAFATLVRRHAAMVLGVCRRVLGNHADADDAFQATFLVLARKAATLDGCDALAGWLHGVAFNIARKLRHMNAQRKARERRPQPQSDSPDPELLAALDEELDHLPEKYRTVIVLCDLEGLTRKEAAHQLGCPEGTVAGRLARARSRLAAQLAGRGLAPVGTIVGVSASQLASAAVAPELIRPILDAETISPRVLALTEGVLKAMFLQKLRATIGVLVVCALAFAGFSHVAATDPEDKPNDPPQAKKADGPEPPAESQTNKLTVIPLRKLDAVKSVREILSEAAKVADFRGGAMIISVPGENVLLVYGDEEAARQIDAAAQRLGEVRMVGTVVRLRDTKAEDAARVLREAFGKSEKVTISPLRDENALIVYASVGDTEVIRKMLGKAVVSPAAKDVPPKRSQVRLTALDAKEVAPALADVFRSQPHVRVSADAAANQLLIQADDATTKEIQEVIDAMQKAAKPDDRNVKQLAADVGLLKERVRWSEVMVKKGVLTTAQLEVERAKLKIVEEAFSRARKTVDDRLTAHNMLADAINEQKIRLINMTWLPWANPREMEEIREAIAKLQQRHDELHQLIFPPPTKGR